MSPKPSIVEHLYLAADKAGDQTALHHPGGAISFAELARECTRTVTLLRQMGVRSGTHCSLMVPPGPEFLTLSFALIQLGAVLVLVDPGMGLRNLKHCLSRAAAEVFIGSPKAHLARLIFGWSRDSVRTNLRVGFGLLGGQSFARLLRSIPAIQTQEPWEPPEQDDTAAIVFTSGSTGPPKGVLYTHRMFSAQAKLLKDSYAIKDGETDLATFPLFALYDPALGMSSVFPKMDFTRPGGVKPLHIIDPIHKHAATHMFGSPALLDRVGRFAKANGIRFPSLRRVLSAGAPVSDKVLQRFLALLSEEGDLHTPYGATEALPISSISARSRLAMSGDSLGKGVCVGAPLEDLGVGIIPISEKPVEVWDDDLLLERGEIGELVVWGDNVSSGYYDQPEANRLAKIRDQTGVRHRMGDLGHLDEQGRIWFCGRKSHRVTTSQGLLFTVPCEGIFNQHTDVYRTALVGIGDSQEKTPVLCVEVEPGVRPSERLRRELLALGSEHAMTRAIQTILFHKSFPVDIRHNAKIFREKLSVWAQQQLR